MHCPFCNYSETEVMETRTSENGTVVRRRRKCLRCEKRFTTYERVEELPILVIKKDGRRERFSRNKLRGGIVKAAEKTTISASQIEKIIETTEYKLKNQPETEVKSRLIGTIVAQKLKKLDKVAYIRFASVFKRFVEAREFQKELKKIL